MENREFKDYYAQLAQHGQIHRRFDAVETGLDKIGNPDGSASLVNLKLSEPALFPRLQAVIRKT